MKYDCTKPLGKELSQYLAIDWEDIKNEMQLNGITFESQFKTLWSMVCKHNTLEIINLLKEELGLDIWYAYSKKVCYFVYYDKNKFSEDEAKIAVEKYVSE